MLHQVSVESERGGVLTEFVIVIPMLLVFFLGIMGTGQLMSHLTWISQATYIGAVSGASTSQIAAEETIRGNLERLRGLQYRGRVESQNWDVTPEIIAGHRTGKPIVRVDVDAEVSPMVKAITSMNLGVGVAAPYLVPNPSQFSGLTTFANPQGVSGCPAGGCIPVVRIIRPKVYMFDDYSVDYGFTPEEYEDFVTDRRLTGRLDSIDAVKDDVFDADDSIDKFDGDLTLIGEGDLEVKLIP